MAEPVIFRLLDGVVGWDVLDSTGLEGFDDLRGGVALARLSPDAVDPAALLPFLPPARLAPGCGRCAWYLVTPAPSRLLRLQCGVEAPPCEQPYPCGEAFVPIDCLPDLAAGVAVAARRHHVAVSDRGADEVRILAASGQELLAVIPLAEPGPLAFPPWGELLVATNGQPARLRRFSFAGAPLGDWPAPLPVPGGTVDRLAFAQDCALWLVMSAPDGSLSLWRATREAPAFVRADPRDLAASFAPTTLAAVADDGFCLRDGAQGPTCCFDWYGRPIDGVHPAPGIPRAKQGQLLTVAIDSGRPRCRWHRVRIDFPRSTSLEHLPPVYREDPRAEDFTERFLSLFDASVEELDRAIERFPALLDGGAVPEPVLPWLGTFLDLAFEASWSADRRRALLAATPGLYRRRGTREGLAEAIRLVLGVEPVIQELAAERAWGALSHTAQLGAVRLFSPARARFTLGASALCTAPLRSFGDPDLDPLAAAAWRLRVLIPAVGAPPAAVRERLTRLLDSQKPAHTIVTTRTGGSGFVVGSWSSAGVDTLLAPLPAPVLGGAAGNVRLSRATVLWTRRGGARGPLSVGRTAAVGIHTVTA